MGDSAPRPPAENAVHRAVYDTGQFMKSIPFWLLEVLGGGAVGMVAWSFWYPPWFLALLPSGWTPREHDSAATILVTVGYLAMVALFTFSWSLARAPYKQRDEARGEIQAWSLDPIAEAIRELDNAHCLGNGTETRGSKILLEIESGIGSGVASWELPGLETVTIDDSLPLINILYGLLSSLPKRGDPLAWMTLLLRSSNPSRRRASYSTSSR